MIDGPLLLAFIGAISILTITPGVDTAIVIRSAMESRRSAGFAAIGVALGCLTWGAVVSLGLGALLHASELAYATLKLLGAGYLVWLGCKLLLKPRNSLKMSTGLKAVGARPSFRRGFLTNILNPKVGVFYVTFLPQFIPVRASVASYSFFLACLHVTLTLLWFAILIIATAPLIRILREPGPLRWMDRITGGVLIAFGVKLATSSSAR